ncbi:DNA polymerase III subunit delta [Companilactobacillus pabuli]|uniref:DNA polymerase III subunit delta n=1 Tax=Companilactobacillus pabuli TaxID=2714036 RepID=A0A7L7KVK7_9LACO|nr:DNA polymerase III subunit delta [Companilactobacillus pabuli]AKP04078.1 DNA polymerase III subunit delta [Companilactobacillus farciminis]AKS52383.1 DNA polymerase III subunit delta [Companilactobacillus farciminis]MDG5113348.1 DNA polymerase III subunit delta [Companilactobacillus pabuli]QMT83853.1 DNA polymerase III subunit delta [Companilactobacillus pabuli]GAQ01359.1 DNA polymerase III subunit delta [Companilactobacillus farciminis]
MKVTELKNNLKQGNLSNVYLITGKEQVFIKEIQKSFKEIMSAEEREMNFSNFDLEEVSIADLINEAISAPFFGERRLVFAQHPYFLTGERAKNVIEQNVDLLIKYIQDPTPSTILVIFASYDKLDARKKITKQLKKLATVVDAGQMEGSALNRTIKADLNKAGYEIDPDALELLVNKTKGNYSLITNQLAKLKLYSLQTKKIDQTAVNELVPQSLEDNVFDLTTQILNKNIYKAEELYDQFLLQKIDPILLVAIIISQLRLLIQIQILSEKGLSEGTIAKNLRLNPYRVKYSYRQAKALNRKRLQVMYSDCVNLDYQIKSGQGDKELLFDLFIAKHA